RSLQGWDNGYHHALRIPSTGLDPAISYTLQQANVAAITVMIEAAPDANIAAGVVIDPADPAVVADPAQAIYDALNNPPSGSNNVVLLDGGTYLVDRVIGVPGGKTIRGHGATI